jgi:ComF family protein
MQALMLLRSFGQGLADLVLPGHCLACGYVLADSGQVCGPCLDKFDYIEGPRCDKCGQPLGEYTEWERRCGDCERHPVLFDHATAPLRYESVVRDLILQFKFAHLSLIANFFAEILADHLAEMPWMADIDLVQPVPMFWFKRLTRRYNQSELLAAGLASRFGFPIGQVLRKVKHTIPQARLSRTSRAANLRDAFQVTRPKEVAGRTILLVDDVMTTGTTCSECARTLKNAGALQVFAITVARATVR